MSDSDHARDRTAGPVPDPDPEETREWREALRAVRLLEGPERTRALLDVLLEDARRHGVAPMGLLTTPYVNTIPPEDEPPYPGLVDLERRIEAYVRWNALATVVRANREHSGVGGHIASYASAAILYEVGFQHFWRARVGDGPGDLVYIQGHSAPGVYARSFLEGRIGEDALLGFRREASMSPALSSYPHPWLMPEYWEFPTVSMGLGPIQAVYQARLLRYLEHRGLRPATDRKVWAMLGDGEMDEPESLAALSLAAREGLDNLVFVVNCNLQRLDGPVRGNGKIIQELEALFRAAGWEAIKVIWGRRWDPLLARDHDGRLRRRMEECLDGDYQTFKAKDGAYVREHFFGVDPELKAMVAEMSDEDIWRLNRGGNDRRKVYAAYHRAVRTRGRPVVILAKSIKGYGMGRAGEAMNVAHQQKKLDLEALREFRDRFSLPLDDKAVEELRFLNFAEGSPERRYLLERRRALGGFLPARRTDPPSLEPPPSEVYAPLLEASGEREFSTTMAAVRLLGQLLRDKTVGPRIVPIVPDEARTFGMEGLFRPYGIYSALGQRYTPPDAQQIAPYREDVKGQILEEGISEAGSTASWLAAATAHTNHALTLVPFFFFYSIFGFQRAMDLLWAAGDAQARGFLFGGTAGRTTLEGEGLQHCDGQTQVMASLIPSCVAYDPCYAYEVAVIVREAYRRMYVAGEKIFVYLTVTNENYAHPALPPGVEEGIVRGIYPLRTLGEEGRPEVQLLGSGAILREVERAAEILASDYGVRPTVWSVTSFTELRREARALRRRAARRARGAPEASYLERALAERPGPVVAATDYASLYAEQIREFLPRRYVTLGTDGYGRSDIRPALRRFFEVDAEHVAAAALRALLDEKAIKPAVLEAALKRFGIDPELPPPWTR
jgi:pyruvate dehydrogenase E1 component